MNGQVADNCQGSQNRATLAGMMAIAIWSSISVLTHMAGLVPPFQLVAMSFAVAFLIGLAEMAIRGVNPRIKELNLRALLLGVTGLFGYHFFLFVALQNAPVLEATLINYLWPLLIVLFSALLPQTLLSGRLTIWHVAGALCGFIGAGLIVTNGKAGLTGEGALLGYGAAAAAALTWSGYSVASRLFARVPTQAVTIYCLLTMIGAGIAHLAFETTVWPQTAIAWLAVFLLGLGPVGGAFYFWDVGMKQGDIRMLGVLSYFAPLFNMILLIVTGISTAGVVLWLSAALIIGGALLAARDMLMIGRRPK